MQPGCSACTAVETGFHDGGQIEVPVEIANFGATPLTNATTKWAILDSSGRGFADGEFPAQTIPIGKNFVLGNISVDLANLPAARQYILDVWASPNPKDESQKSRLEASQSIPLFQNNWNFWLYPAQMEDSKSSNVLVTHNWSEAATRLAAGGKVLFMPGAAVLDPAKCPPMKNIPVFWNIQMTVRPPANPTPKFDAMLGLLCDTNHPALAEFPTEANCDWQWTEIVNNVRSVNLSKAPLSLRPIVSAIDDWNRNWRLGVIFECNVGPGRLLVSAINLDNERGGPELQQLRRSLLDYMDGNNFKPAATLTPEQVASLWMAGSSSPTTTQPARAFDPDLNDGHRSGSKKPVNYWQPECGLNWLNDRPGRSRRRVPVFGFRLAGETPALPSKGGSSTAHLKIRAMKKAAFASEGRLFFFIFL